ncbi:uncharacterized protein LOC143070808 [Mytilus galloprovincialis]|uniref:uncharacterized protein LOC143070808 n=1 Tax=Mytilus galloprovincialis TaxID=29158 RepID=UPI003F7CA38F
MVNGEFYSATFKTLIESMRLRIESLFYHYNTRHITPSLNRRSSLPVSIKINNIDLFIKNLHRDFKNYFLSISSMEMSEQDPTSSIYKQLRALNSDILMTMCITSNNNRRHRRNMPCRRSWNQKSHYQARSLKVLESLHTYLGNLENNLQLVF